MTDTNGTNLACYVPIYESGVFNPISAMFGVIIGIIVQILMVFVGFSLFLVRLITDESLLLGFLGDILQTVLDAVHSVIPPIGLAALAFGIAMLRATSPSGPGGGFLDWLFPESATSKIKENMPGWMNMSKHSVYHKKDPVRNFSRAVTQGFVVAAIIVVLSMNPIYILIRAINAVASLGSSIIDPGDGTATYATGLVEGVISIVNFPSFDIYSTSCAPTWIDSMAQGEIRGLNQCLASEGIQPPSAGVMAILMSIAMVAIIGSLAYYLIQMFLRGSLFLAILIWDFISLPYVLGWEMFKPGFASVDNRKWYDKIQETFFEFLVYLGYFLLIVFLLTSGPTLIVALVADMEIAAILKFLLIALIMFFGGKYAYKIGPSDKLNLDHIPSWQSLFKNVMYKDETSGERNINWSQLGRNIAETKPGRYVRTLGKEQTADELKALDDERRKQVRQSISDAGADLGEGSEIPAIYQDMWDHIGFHRSNIPNQKATTESLFRAGKISEAERDRRMEELDKREEILEQMAKKKDDLLAKIEAEKPGNLVEVPAELRKEMGKDYATREEIRSARELAKAKTVSAMLKGLGFDISPEQIVTWDSAEKDLMEVEDKIDALQQRQNRMSPERYAESLKKLSQQREGLEKVVAAKQEFSVVEGSHEPLIQDPRNPGTWITRSQLDLLNTKRALLDELGFSADEFLMWTRRATEIPKIDSEIQKIKQHKAAGTISDKDFETQMTNLTKNKQKIEGLSYHMAGIEKDGGLFWVEDPDNPGAIVPAYRRDDILARKQEEKKAREIDERNDSHGTETANEAANRRFAEFAALNGKSEQNVLSQLRSEGAQLTDLLHQLGEAETDEEKDKIRRSVEELKEKITITQDSLHNYAKVLSESRVKAIKNPLYDPTDPLSREYDQFITTVDSSGKTTEEAFVFAEAEKHSISAQREVYDAVKPARDEVEKASKMVQNMDMYSSVDVAHAISRSIAAAKAIVNASPNTESTHQLSQEISGIESLVSRVEVNEPESVQALTQAAASLKVCTDTFIQTLAADRGKAAAQQRTESLLQEFKEKGIDVNIPSVPPIVQMNEDQLRRLSPMFLENLTDKINVTLDKDTLEAISNASPSISLITSLGSEQEMLARDIYQAGEASVRSDEVQSVIDRVVSQHNVPTYTIVTSTPKGNPIRVAKDSQSRTESDGGYGTNLPYMPKDAMIIDGSEAKFVLIQNNETGEILLAPYVRPENL